MLRREESLLMYANLSSLHVVTGNSIIQESHTVSESSQKTKKTKIKQPTAGPASRFERMHHNLFAGQASIETYGKTPKKKTGECGE